MSAKLDLRLMLRHLPRFKWALGILLVLLLAVPFALDSATAIITVTLLSVVVAAAVLYAFTSKLPPIVPISDDYALVVGGGTFPDMVLLTKKQIPAAEFGLETRPTYVPFWNDPAFDAQFPQSVAFLVLYPIIGNIDDAPTRIPPAIGRGVLALPQSAGKDDFTEASDLAKIRIPAIQGAMQTWNVLKKPPLCLIHVVATGFSSCAFFSEVTGAVATEANSGRENHVVYFLDGLAGDGKHKDPNKDMTKALGKGLRLLEDRLKREDEKIGTPVTRSRGDVRQIRPGLIISDNITLQQNSWEPHLRILYMLAGATRIVAGPNEGDIHRITRDGRLWVPFVPRGFANPKRMRSFNTFQLQQMITMQDWFSMWDGVKTNGFKWDGRGGMGLLLAGDPGVCTDFASAVAHLFRQRNLPAPATVIAPVPGATRFWVAPLVHALPGEVVGSHCDEVLAPYCSMPPYVGMPPRPDNGQPTIQASRDVPITR
ncbi:MAG: hypothetical protein FJW26_14830 [Acidimicrobiia bacterium]|nr:hypothetical protein [Acidimicrobiia bacterium]